MAARNVNGSSESDNTALITDPHKQFLFMAAIVLITTVTMMNLSMVTVALPTYKNVFHVDLSTVQWVLLGYNLAIGMTMPLSAYFSGRYGGKNVLYVCLIGMMIGSIGCAFSWNFYSLVAFRILKGAFAGISTPFTMSLIYHYIPTEKCAHYMAISMMMNNFGMAVGPSVAGLILQVTTWRVLFLVNVPLALVALFSLKVALPIHETLEYKDEKIDWVGIFLVTAGTGLTMFVFSRLSAWGVNGNFLVGMTTGLLLIGIFIYRQMHTTHPLLKFSVLAIGPFAVIVIINCLINCMMGITNVLLGVYYQTLLHYTPFEMGIFLIGPALSMLLATFMADKFFKKMSHKSWILLGIGTAFFGNFCMSHVQLHTMVVLVILFMTFRYAGMGLLMMPLNDYGMRRVPREMTSHASSMFSWTKQLVNIVSLNVLTVTMDLNTGRYYRELTGSGSVDVNNPAYAQAAMHGFQTDFGIIACILLVALLFAFLAVKNEERG